MKINITYQCDTAAEAKEVLEAVNRLGNLPYRLEGFGQPIVSGDRGALIELTELQEGSASPNMDLEAQKAPNVLSTVPPQNVPAIRNNVSPGEPAIGKIGSKTKEDLLFVISSGVQASAKFSEHMKLLWKRGEVKYDGQEYYL